MAKKNKSKKLPNKKDKNILFSIILILLIGVVGLIFLQKQSYKNTSLISFPTPKPVEFGKPQSDISREPLEQITVYLSDGTQTTGLVGKNWNNGKFAEVDVMLSNGAGSNQILKNVDGKWVSINLDISQNYLCAYYTNAGMTQSDLNDLRIKQKNGVCSASVSEEEYKDWNPDPSNFTN